MSETFSPLLPETHKPELLAGTSSFSYGGMDSPPRDVVLTANSVGGSPETASFPGGISHAADTQLDALQTQTLSTNDLATRLAASVALPASAAPSSVNGNSAGPDITAGHAVADFLASGTATKSDITIQNGQSGNLPSLQFLSHETAIQVVTPDTTTVVQQQAATTVAPSSSPQAASVGTGETAAAGTQLSAMAPSVSTVISGQTVSNVDETTSDASSSASSSSDVLPQHAMLRSLYVDVPGYTYAVNNTNGGTDVLSFSDNYDQLYPGIVIDTSYDDIGNRRDAAWVQPSMKAYPSSDSGNRAGQFQNWFKDNKDTIGYNVIGTPIPDQRWTNLRDWGHDRIKWDHFGTQEVASEILRKLATQDNQTTTQLNTIWHNVLGTAIDSASLTDAINQISIGHATLGTERQALAHSSAVSDRLKEIISAVQNRPVNAGDDAWIHAQQDSLDSGGQNIQQIRQSLARWSADNGQYDAVFQATHDTAMQKADRDYAATQIGNGWSVQDYRWNEAHSDRAWREYGDLIQRATNHAPNADLIRQMQDNIGNGSSLTDERHRIAYSEVGSTAINEMYQHMLGVDPTPSQAAYYQDKLAQGASIFENRIALANGNEGVTATKTMYQNMLGVDPTPSQAAYYQDKLAQGASIFENRVALANGNEGVTATKTMYQNMLGVDPTPSQAPTTRTNWLRVLASSKIASLSPMVMRGEMRSILSRGTFSLAN